jgi:hypothetical protein
MILKLKDLARNVFPRACSVRYCPCVLPIDYDTVGVMLEVEISSLPIELRHSRRGLAP